LYSIHHQSFIKEQRLHREMADMEASLTERLYIHCEADIAGIEK